MGTRKRIKQPLHKFPFSCCTAATRSPRSGGSQCDVGPRITGMGLPLRTSGEGVSRHMASTLGCCVSLERQHGSRRQAGRAAASAAAQHCGLAEAFLESQSEPVLPALSLILLLLYNISLPNLTRQNMLYYLLHLDR